MRAAPSPPLQGQRACNFVPLGTILETAGLASSGGWHEQQQQAPPLQPPPPRRPPSSASPRSTLLPAAITEQPHAVGMSQHDGSLSSSSHGSMGELAVPEAELSDLEQRKVVVLG